MHHIPGIKNELSDYISRNNFHALIGESSEALAREAFPRMHVQLDLSMRTAGIPEGWSLTDYQSEYKEILQTLSTGLEPRVIDGHQWYKNNHHLFYEDRIVVPEAPLDGCLQWSHLSSGHTGANRSVDFFRECYYSSLTLTELRSRMQTFVDACGCHASKQSDSRDRVLICSLPILTRSRGGPATGRCGGHAQVSRQAKHYAHRGINAVMSCDKAFQNPCHSEMRERKYVQQHIRICTYGVKTGLG